MIDFPDFSAMLDEGYRLRGPKRWPTYHGGMLDRSQYVTSSEVGGCARRVKFGKAVPSTGFKNWGYAERGNVIEAWAIDLIRDAIEHTYTDYQLLYYGDRQFSFTDGRRSGTPDGLLLHRETELGLCLDIKSVDPRTNYDKLPKRTHTAQVIQNIDMLNANQPITVVGGVLFYIDASNFQRRKVVPVEYSIDAAEALREKADRIMDAAGPEDLPAEGLYMDKECDMCSFKPECSGIVSATKEQRDELQNMERAMKDAF